MTAKDHITRLTRSRFWYFFPIRLLILHIKRNHFLLFLWLLLMAITTGNFAMRFGVPQQFLMPEYRGVTGILSFTIVGFALGGFIVAFNLYTYILHGFRFPFIATLSRPFQKLTLNNFILPAIFLITYIWESAQFQYTRENVKPSDICWNIAGLLLGISLFLAISFSYFLVTNKSAESYAVPGKKRRRSRRRSRNPVDSPIHRSHRWTASGRKFNQWHVETYLFHFWKINLARESSHYKQEVLQKVFAQNHINASFFEIALVISFIVVGTFRDNDFFIIPAAASALLFFTMMLMIASAVFSWIKGWTVTVIILFLVVINIFYTDLRLIVYENHAYGMNYEDTSVPYPHGTVNTDPSVLTGDKKHTEQILEKWLLKNTYKGKEADEKPRLIIINCSGGGSRSAYWTMRALMDADHNTNGELLEHTILITGASGGMLGASYLREIMLREATGQFDTRYDTTYCEDMSRDLLNPVMQSIATNDWFVRLAKVHDGEYTYSKDRGYAFERQFNKNTRNLLDRRLRDYAIPEQEAVIPMMVLSPSIVNDGRRLIISSQPVSYLTQSNDNQANHALQTEDIEFSRLFAAHDAQNLKFTSALRMNATFPYILPMVSLPCEPHMEVMDAGIRDNFGLKTTMQFLYTFHDWIAEHTSGVVVVQVRDLPKGVQLEEMKQSLTAQLTAPIGSIYGNITKTQDYNSFQMFKYLNSWYEGHIDMVTFQLPLNNDNFVSLSWHLTETEKKTIRGATSDPYYLSELDRLKKFLTD